MMLTWNAFTRDGQHIGTVQATNSREAHRLAWVRHWGWLFPFTTPKDDGSITVVMA